LCPVIASVSPSYCIQQDFVNAPLNPRGQYLIGMGNTALEGCTVLTVVSARAVYMVGHILLIFFILIIH